MLDRKLFQIFTIELHGGERFEIDPRTTVIRDGAAIFLGPRGMAISFDHKSVNQIIEASENTGL